MNNPRVTFSDVDLRYRNTYRFYDDRIECDWDTAFQKGKMVYPVADISGRFGETTTFAYGLKPILRTLCIFLMLGLVFHLGFSQPLLTRIGFLFYALSGVGVVLAITKLKKDRWIYVLRDDGHHLFVVREKGLKGLSRDEFFREVQRYAKPANQSPEATPGSRPPLPPSSPSGAPQL